ncbi:MULTISPECIES: hypothetical protein [Pseudomonas]|uniref:hypothetical protein n=1 Tax=Pseudomonas TaxID=286 RepID=UPI000AC89AC1|nr:MULTISPECIES: hypothetical protein [Pseudomonas]MDG9809438.1 hypothetical protein [Pseudomonas juntendi]MDG9815795.1 hypothetical protein [Pseudomonas putida]
MAVTKDEFMQDAVNEIATFPTISARYQIGDPLILQGIQAIAAQLAHLSQQVDVTGAEPWTKARDVTVRADAAVKGILPFGTPCIGKLKVTNGTDQTMRVIAGRSLMDAQGRFWVVTGGATVLAGQVSYLTAKQVRSRTFTHQVNAVRSFYTIDVTDPDIGYIADIRVDGFERSNDFANILPGDKVYNVKSDEYSALSLQFGMSTAGYVPQIGEVLSVSIDDTEGNLSLSVGMSYAFEYNELTTSNIESKMVLELAEVLQQGADPMDIATMREVCSYPAIYDESAVFGSNFDFLVRKKVVPLTFLSIWNERREEQVRGANVKNMNTLFVAALKDGTTQDVLHAQIAQHIQRADDSYRIQRVTVVEKVVGVTLTLYITSVYDSEAVKEEVRTRMLKAYGRDSAWAKRGEAKMLEKDIYKDLGDNVAALSPRVGNLIISNNTAGAAEKPEHFRYITAASLILNVVEAD